MAELATVARPYAEAVFKSSKADLAGAVLWLDGLAAVAGNPQLLEFAANPKVSDQQVYDVVTGVAKVDLQAVAQNFLRAVIENGRLVALPEIARQFRVLMNAQGGASDALVHSAFPIPASALAELGATLEKRFGRKLNLSVREDTSLIGGIRVVVGDEVLDTSVKARLEQMKAALTA